MKTEIPMFSIARIKDIFDHWREMGSRRLRSGTELIGEIPDCEEHAWLHVVHPGLSLALIDELEAKLQTALPRDLRALYRRYGGLSFFQGAFRLFGFRPPDARFTDDDLQPDDVLRLNQELDTLGWKPKTALAVAENGWDMSVHLLGMTEDPHKVHRCERQTGRILEEHPNIWVCVAARLYKLDTLLVKPDGPDTAQPGLRPEST